MPKLKRNYCYISYHKLENPNGSSVSLYFLLIIEEKKKSKISSFYELFELFNHYGRGQDLKLGTPHEI